MPMPENGGRWTSRQFYRVVYLMLSNIYLIFEDSFAIVENRSIGFRFSNLGRVWFLFSPSSENNWIASFTLILIEC